MFKRKQKETVRTIFERFFLEARGDTSNRIDVVFVLEDLGYKQARTDEAMTFLETRGLIDVEGDGAYLTEFGVSAGKEDVDVADLPKHERPWKRRTDPSPAPSRPSGSSGRERAETERVAPANVPRPDWPTLDLIGPNGEVATFELPRTAVRVGRSPDAEIRLTDPRASKLHCEIRPTDIGYSVRDLGSANGTVLNGDPIEQSRLEHGDEIQVGESVLLFRSPSDLDITLGP